MKIIDYASREWALAPKKKQLNEIEYYYEKITKKEKSLEIILGPTEYISNIQQLQQQAPLYHL